MRRRTKYRALNSRNEWVYGQYASRKDGEEHYIVRDLMHIDGWEWRTDASFIRPETLGQYTGIEDINGVEIYEGDIAKFKYNTDKEGVLKVGVVTFDMRELCYFIRTNSTWGCDHNLAWCESEIIGNIYENPELWEKGNDGK